MQSYGERHRTWGEKDSAQCWIESQSRRRPRQGGARTGQLTVKRDGQPLRKQLRMAGRYVTAEQPGADSHATRHCVSVSTGPGLPTPSCARAGGCHFLELDCRRSQLAGVNQQTTMQQVLARSPVSVLRKRFRALPNLVSLHPSEKHEPGPAARARACLPERSALSAVAPVGSSMSPGAARGYATSQNSGPCVPAGEYCAARSSTAALASHTRPLPARGAPHQSCIRSYLHEALARGMPLLQLFHRLAGLRVRGAACACERR